MFRPNSTIFRLEIQCQRKNYLSDLNAGVQERGRDLVYKYGVSKRDLVPSPTHLHLDQRDNFSSDTVFPT